MSPGISSWILLSAALFDVWLVGVMLRRSPLVILLSIEIMLNAGNLLLIAASRYSGTDDGQVFALVVMGVAASEVVVGLGLIVALSRARVELDVDELRSLHGCPRPTPPGSRSPRRSPGSPSPSRSARPSRGAPSGSSRRGS